MIILAAITNRIFTVARTNLGDRICCIDCGIVGCMTHALAMEVAIDGQILRIRARRAKFRVFSWKGCIFRKAYQTGYWIPAGGGSVGSASGVGVSYRVLLCLAAGGGSGARGCQIFGRPKKGMGMGTPPCPRPCDFFTGTGGNHLAICS